MIELPSRIGDNVPLFCYYDKNAELLFDRFVRTMNDRSVSIYELRLDRPVGQPGERAGGPDNMLFKARFLETIARSYPDRFVLVSDVDVQFFRPFADVCIASLGDDDIAFQREGPLYGCNTGFIAMRCNSRTIRFWSEVRERLAIEIEQAAHGSADSSGALTDQRFANELLAAAPEVRWSRLPSTIWAWSHGGLSKDLVLHHANGVRLERDKLAQMDDVALSVRSGLVE